MSSEPQHQIDPTGPGGGGSGLTPLAELQLVDEYRRGDIRAAEALLRTYERRLYSICCRMVRDEQDARDVTQDAMLKILQGLDGYDGRAKLSTWVIRVTMNCCLSHLRRQKLRRHFSLDEGEPGPVGEPSPPSRVEQSEMRGFLRRGLAGLDPDMRAVLVLRDMQELEYHRIAQVLDIPVGTVKSRLFRARLALREAVEVEMQRREGPRADEG